MPLPKCFDLLNLTYFVNLTAQIDATESAAELQALVNSAFADLSLIESTITSQVNLLSPILALLTPPTNLSELVTWAGNFITDFLTPYVVPYTTYGEQLTELTAQISDLTVAINAQAALKGWSITIPSVGVTCTL